MTPLGGQFGQRAVVVDLEATCWDARDPVLAARQRAETEVVEIGAVLFDGAAAPQELQRFVRPKRWPVLSAFCTELTGITQADVDAADAFPEVFRAFLAFTGGDEGLVFVSWGAWDDAVLRRECRRWGLSAPRWSPRNAKALVAAAVGERRGLREAVEAAGLPLEGRLHRGLDDARQVVAVLRWLQDRELTTPRDPPP